MTVEFPSELYATHAGPYRLHSRTDHGVYHFLGEYETDYVHYGLRDWVAGHTTDYVWVTDAEGFTLEAYDKDHDDYLDY